MADVSQASPQPALGHSSVGRSQKGNRASRVSLICGLLAVVLALVSGLPWIFESISLLVFVFGTFVMFPLAIVAVVFGVRGRALARDPMVFGAGRAWAGTSLGVLALLATAWNVLIVVALSNSN